MNEESAFARKIVCQGHCSFFKPGSDEALACRGFSVLEDLLAHDPDMARDIPFRQHPEISGRYEHLLHHALCRHCDFFIDGCDFTDPEHTGQALPCGGYRVADLLLQKVSTGSDRLPGALFPGGAKIALHPLCVLKHLESPYLYHIAHDELYELDTGGFGFLQQCDGSHLVSKTPVDKDFLEFCLDEGLLVTGTEPSPCRLNLRPSPIPSLRYLEVQLTRRCNLACKHCYLGEPEKTDLPLSQALSLLEEFEAMQGLRVLFSGGEPLLYPDLETLNHELPRFLFRKVLLTNGTLIEECQNKDWCHFDEIQFSLDGLKSGHDVLRGSGAFDQTVRGIEFALNRGVPVSIATMVHKHNLKEFEGLAKRIEGWDIVEWNIDVPCATGRLSGNPDFLVEPEQGAPLLAFATGGSYHGADEPFACGYHLCTVTAAGNILKCGFFHEPLGTLSDGLEVAWKRLKPIPLGDLECGPCPSLSDCKGGCRFRAPSMLGKDPVMCALYQNRDGGQEDA